MHDSSMTLAMVRTTRRRLLGAGAGLGIGALASQPLLAMSEGAPYGIAGDIPKSSRENQYAWAKAWSTLGDRVVYAGHKGIFYAVIEGREVPVAGYVGFGVSIAEFTADGELRVRAKDATFYTDLDSGEILNHWDNPWTGETVPVVGYVNDRADMRIGTEMPATSGFRSGRYGWELNFDFESATAPRRQTAEPTPFQLPWFKVGNQLMMGARFRLDFPNPVDPARWPKASSGPHVTTTEHFTFFVNADAVADSDQLSAPFTAGFFRVTPWLPWMRMGQSGIDGYMFARSHSYKTDGSLGDVPRVVLEKLERDHPDMLAIDRPWGEGPWVSTWSQFAEMVAPEVEPDT